jgi:hypothetical protein
LKWKKPSGHHLRIFGALCHKHVLIALLDDVEHIEEGNLVHIALLDDVELINYQHFL